MLSKELFIALGLLALLTILKPLSIDIAFLAVFFYQICVPQYFGIPLKIFHADLKSDLIRVAWVSLVTLIPYGFGFFALQNYLATQKGFALDFNINFSWALLLSFFVNLIFVALPEEYFYRGFLQAKLLKHRHGVLCVFILVNLFFALGHFMGEYSLVRLLPFFPGLIFSWLAYKSENITGAILYHTICNVFSEWLSLCIGSKAL